jgi:hypothetical protein
MGACCAIALQCMLCWLPMLNLLLTLSNEDITNTCVAVVIHQCMISVSHQDSGIMFLMLLVMVVVRDEGLGTLEPVPPPQLLHRIFMFILVAARHKFDTVCSALDGSSHMLCVPIRIL